MEHLEVLVEQIDVDQASAVPMLAGGAGFASSVEDHTLQSMHGLSRVHP